MSDLGARLLQMDLEGVPKARRDRVQIFRLLVMLGTRVRGLMDRQLESSELTTQQAACLAVASSLDGAGTQGVIARYMGVSQQNVRQLVDSLARKGLVQVLADPADARAKRIRPTKKARAIFERRNDADYAAVEGWMGGLSAADAATLRSLLEKLSASLPRRDE